MCHEHAQKVSTSCVLTYTHINYYVCDVCQFDPHIVIF